MLSQAKVLYQVKLILDYLPEEEYKLIPQEMIDYIEDNFEYDENFSIDPEIPLEKQKIEISKAKNLFSEYKDAMREKDNKIEELRRNNQDLYNCIQGLPKIIKKLFIKNTDIKLLK